VRVVHADELPQRVVAVRRHLAVAVLLYDVAPAVVLIGKVHGAVSLALPDGRDQRRGGVAAVGICALDEGVDCLVGIFAVGHFAGGNAAKGIVSVFHLALVRIVVHLRDAAVLVVGEGRLVVLVARALVEGLQAVLRVIRQR